MIDDELRRAAFDRQVQVRVLGSLWNHTDPSMLQFLNSLAEISRTGQGSIEVVGQLTSVLSFLGGNIMILHMLKAEY